MLRILGHHKRLCDGITRRDLLQIGGASFLGLNLPRLLEAQSGLTGPKSVARADLAASFSTGMAQYPWMITEKAIARGSAPDTSFA